MHVFPEGLVYFSFVTILWVLVFSFSFIYFLISVFWPYPGDSSAFDFSLKSYMVNFLSHSSEMEKLKGYTDVNTFTMLILLLVIYCSLRPD